MPHIGVFDRIFLEHKRHKCTVMALNSSNSPVSLPSPAMRSNTGKDFLRPSRFFLNAYSASKTALSDSFILCPVAPSFTSQHSNGSS